MKKIIVSAGLVAIGTTGVQAVFVPGFATTDKPWSVSATLRGFYDDNYQLASRERDHRDSFGFEVSPSAIVGISGEQTAFAARYTYSLRYYDDRERNRADHSHEFNAWLTHTFTERYSLDLVDSFVIAQEPSLVDPSLGTVTRANGNNIRNTGAINFHARLSRLVDLELGYANTLIDYENDGGDFLEPSRSGLLDRMEHTAHVEVQWQVLPETRGILGYQYGQTDFTGDESIDFAVLSSGLVLLFSDSRNVRSHAIYVGAVHNFRRDLTATVKAGGQYFDYYNSPSETTDVGPFAEASLRYTYLPDSYLEAGFRHTRNTTDASGVTVKNDKIDQTTDQESSVIYATVNHRLTPKLIASVTGQYQYSVFNGGPVDSEADNIFLVGLNLEYRFNPHFSAHVGYNYDQIDSDLVGRGYERNRVYMGVTASY